MPALSGWFRPGRGDASDADAAATDRNAASAQGRKVRERGKAAAGMIRIRGNRAVRVEAARRRTRLTEHRPHRAPGPPAPGPRPTNDPIVRHERCDIDGPERHRHRAHRGGRTWRSGLPDAHLYNRYTWWSRASPNTLSPAPAPSRSPLACPAARRPSAPHRCGSPHQLAHPRRALRCMR